MYNQKYLLLLLYGHIKRVSGINRISGVRGFDFEKGFLLESVLVWILNSGFGFGCPDTPSDPNPTRCHP